MIPRSSLAAGSDAAGDPILVLAETHRDFLAFLERRVGNRAVAEDILQDAFVRATVKSSSLLRDESAVAWFYRILRNGITDHYRRQGVAQRSLDAAASRADLAEADPDTRDFVCRCVTRLAATLKPEYAEVLRRVDVEGASMTELAAETGISPGNAAVRAHRARQSLRRLVEDSCRVCAEHGCLDCDCQDADGHA